MPKLAIDLRSLNYPVRTGVNLYFLNVLNLLPEIKAKHRNLEIVGFGLNNKQKTNLENEFPWFRKLFNTQLSLAEFYNLTWLENIWFLPKSWLNNLINISVWFGNIFGFTGQRNIQDFTHLFQPQIKAILAPKQVNWLVAVHDFFYLQMPKWNKVLLRPNESYLLAKTILSRSTQVWANSISTANQTKYFFPENKHKIKLVYLALPKKISALNNLGNPQNNNQQTDKHLNIRIDQSYNSNKYFLALSGIEPRKNWVNLLKAWQVLENQNDWGYSLILAGRIVDNTYYSYLLKLVDKLHLKKIVWKLEINDDEKTLLLSNAQALIYPSLFEGFGFPILEAWASSIPVIVSSQGSGPEIGQNGVVIVNPLDVADIASSIKMLSLDNNYRQQLVINGQKRLKSFSWDEYKTKLENWLLG